MKTRIIITTLFAILIIIAELGNVNIGQAKSLLIRDADNKVDPVDGSIIAVKKFNTAYDRRYWFNSYDNVQKFKTDPGKYIEQLNLLEKEYSRDPEKYTPAKFLKTPDSGSSKDSKEKSSSSRW